MINKKLLIFLVKNNLIIDKSHKIKIVIHLFFLNFINFC